ncbi:class I SAM-dependent methyltransferase [Crocosphaera sp.]|uniref:class I SAM-dependent methyltransferase n=1 Tax=Crocosphaera sp. TaxID=2729996 RepID=UPI003F2279C1
MFNYAELPYGQGGSHPDHNRFNWRCETLLTRNRNLIEDKVVLDLACNTGRLSYPCLRLGAKKVIGVEARQELIDQGKEYLTDQDLKDRMEFVKSDVFNYLASAESKSFDTILCLGFLYHTVRQVEFFRQVKRLSPDNVIIDTNVATNYIWYGSKSFLKKPPMLLMITEDPSKTSDTTDEDGVAFWPTCSFLETMFDRINYNCQKLDYQKNGLTDWSGMKDYKQGQRVSYVAYRKGK